MTAITSLARTDVAALGDVAGRPVVLHYGDTAAEYAALRRGALLIDRSHRMRMSIEGQNAAELLTGLVTNDVLALTPGHGQYAAVLTPKGKIISDVRIFARADYLLVDVPARAAAGWTSMVRKFVNPRIAAYHDRSDVLRDLGVYGVGARRILIEAYSLDGDALEALPQYAHLEARINGTPVLVVRTPDLGLEGYELFVPSEAFLPLWQRALSVGASPAGLEAWEIARIEAGRPEWGLDIDDTTIPQEANFDEMHAISYTKGCYTGQETVARVHFRGHVNRHLRGLLYESPDRLPAKAQLFDESGKLVGDVRSSAISPRLGGIALGMVRREVSLSASLRASTGAAEIPVTVSPLPLPL